MVGGGADGRGVAIGGGDVNEVLGQSMCMWGLYQYVYLATLSLCLSLTGSSSWPSEEVAD